MAGWGKTYPEQAGQPTRLNWAATVVQTPTYCSLNAYPFYRGYELCTINPPNDETSMCFGDSGGPLLALGPSGSGDIELGIASHALCSPTHPSTFTRVDLLARWVSEWIAAVGSLTPSPPPASAPIPLAIPGYYATRPSRARKIVIHVSGDGKHIVGLRIRMPVTCRHGHILSLDRTYLSYANSLMITGHTVRETLEVAANRRWRAGTIGVSLAFTQFGSVEGRLRVRIPFRSRRMGLCTGTLSFAASI
jgi:hypothetical protein